MTKRNFALNQFMLFAFAFSLALGATANASTQSCLAIIKPAKFESSHHNLVAKTTLKVDDESALKQAQDWEKRFNRPQNAAVRVRSKGSARLLSHVRDFFARINNHPHPFAYMRDGTVQKIRVWAKQGDPEINEEVESWITRYESYPADRDRLIERTVFIHLEMNLLKQAEAMPPEKYPVALTLPKAIRDTLMVETEIYANRKEVEKQIAFLQKTESDRFNHLIMKDLNRRRFLQGREFEQAQLEQFLRISLEDLKKFPLALNDKTKRHELIERIETNLENPALVAPPFARYNEIRRSFNDELNFYLGTQRETLAAGEEANEKLRLNDQINLGTQTATLTVMGRIRRLFLVTAPIQIFGLALASGSPILKEQTRNLLFSEVQLHEIAEMPEDKYAAEAYKYLHDHYRISQKNGHWVMTDKATKVLQHIQEMHAEHEEELKKENITEEAFAELIKGPPVSATEFTAIIKMPEDQAKAEATKISSRETTAEKAQLLFYRLLKARKDYLEQHESSSEGEQADTESAPVDAFAKFVVGD